MKIFLLKHVSIISYFLFSMATSALGFAASLVMMRLIPPVEFGRLALFFSIQFIVVPIISFAADNLIAIKKSTLGTAEYEYFRRSYVTLAYFLFLFVQLGFLLSYAAGLPYDSLFLLIPFAALLKYLISVASIEYVMEEKATQYGLVQFFTTALSLVLTILLLKFIASKADSRIAALLLADLIFLLIRYKGRMHFLYSLAFDRQQFRQIMLFGLPLMLAVAPAWVLNESDKIFVAKYADLASVGLYAAACAIGGLMVTFNASLLNATIPKLYSALGVRPKNFFVVTKRFLVKYMLASAVFAGLFASAYGVLAGLILPEKYLAARDVVYLVIFFALARSFYAILGAVTDYLGMTVQKLKGIVMAALAAVFGMVAGISYFGIVGAAIGVGVGYTVLGISLWIYLREKSSQMSDIRELNEDE